MHLMQQAGQVCNKRRISSSRHAIMHLLVSWAGRGNLSCMLDDDGACPAALHMAAANGHSSMVDTLLNAGAVCSLVPGLHHAVAVWHTADRIKAYSHGFQEHACHHKAPRSHNGTCKGLALIHDTHSLPCRNQAPEMLRGTRLCTMPA